MFEFRTERRVELADTDMAGIMHFSREGEELARGQVKTVCCLMREGGGLDPIPIPDSIADAIEESGEAW